MYGMRVVDEGGGMMRRMGWDTKWLRVKDKMCGYVDESNENRTQENGDKSPWR
jgi:hypothetical protein